MAPILTRCGYRCDLCMAFKANLAQNPENSQALSDGWHRYYGFRIPPAEICCDGCLVEDSIPIDRDCPVRPCVIEQGLANCSQCDSYSCEKLEVRSVTLEEMQRSFGEAIPEADYERFIRPYENRRRLDALRSSMSR